MIIADSSITRRHITMPNKMTEEEILRAIFEGPIRPMTREDQAEYDRREQDYAEKQGRRLQECANRLGVEITEIERMQKENAKYLLDLLANVKAGWMTQSTATRNIREYLKFCS